MTSDIPANLDEAITRLTKLIHDHVPSDRARHDMINMVSVISVGVYELRQDVQEASDDLADRREKGSEMKSSVNASDTVEVIVDDEKHPWARVRVREGQLQGCKANALLTPDDLERHALECLKAAAKIRARQ